MKILAIDVAHRKPIAWAFFDGEKLLQYGSTKRKGDAGLNELLGKIDDAELFQPDIIVAEKPYLKINAKTFQQLSFLVETIRRFCAGRGLIFKDVMPAHWKKSYLRGTGFKSASKEANTLFNHLAVHLTGVKNFNPDERDAILFGLYVARREK